MAKAKKQATRTRLKNSSASAPVAPAENDTRAGETTKKPAIVTITEK